MSESEVVRAEREEMRAVRDEQDTGGLRWVAGRRFRVEDLPSEEEL